MVIINISIIQIIMGSVWKYQRLQKKGKKSISFSWYHHGKHWFHVFRTTCNTSVVNITFSIMSADWYCILTCFDEYSVSCFNLTDCFIVFVDVYFLFCFASPCTSSLLTLAHRVQILFELCVYGCMYVYLVISGVYLSVYVIRRCISHLHNPPSPLWSNTHPSFFSFLTSGIVVIFSSLAQRSVTMAIRYNTCWLSFHG